MKRRVTFMLIVGVVLSWGLLGADFDTDSGAGAPPMIKLSRAEVLALIEKAGTSKADWWSDVRLNYPRTLDLSWPKPTGPWNTRKNVGQYMWSIINENPGRWKEGTKFMHYVLAVNKNRPAARKLAIEALAHCYHDLLEDWPRAAYWLQEVDKHTVHQVINLADCYWKLGNKELASAQLRRIRTDYTRYGSAIKLWSDMGELTRALTLAKSSARNGRADAAYMGAGDACRKHGKFRDARTYYQKVLAIPLRDKKDEILKRNQSRARINVEMIDIFDDLDLNKISAGTHSGTSLAYNGDLTVAVTVENARITAVRVTSHQDKQYYSALTDMTSQIIKQQGLKDIDATTGATITAEAVINATARALARGMK